MMKLGGLVPPLSPLHTDMDLSAYTMVPSANTDYLWNALTTDKITEMSGGKMQPFTPDQAAGLMGSWMIETGQMDLGKLDVVEKGNNSAGRGLSQYSHSRRGPYEVARAAALKQGQDVNGGEFQLQYFVDEYLGKHDPGPGKSLSGWTRTFENAPAKGSPQAFAEYYTGSAQERRGYFRPSAPHNDRRGAAAASVKAHYGFAGKGAKANPLNLKPTTDHRPGWMKELGIPQIKYPW